MIVMKWLVVSNLQREMSIVIPLSRSAFSLSMTQAYLNEPLPAYAQNISSYEITAMISKRQNYLCNVYWI